MIWAKIARYELLAPEEIAADRLDACEGCSFFTDNRQCRVCTCFVDFKTILALEQCPKKVWLRVWIKKVKN